MDNLPPFLAASAARLIPCCGSSAGAFKPILCKSSVAPTTVVASAFSMILLVYLHFCPHYTSINLSGSSITSG